MAERYVDAIKAFEERGGMLRMSDALRAGISRRTLYAMRDEGTLTHDLERVRRIVGELAEAIDEPERVSTLEQLSGESPSRRK